MAPPGPRKRRHRKSALRQREILEAALRCFTERGYDQTTMADVCRAASASVGSLYHHFESKEQLARALFLEGVRDAQKVFLPALVRHRSAERGIGALVGSYLDWVEAHPDWARFLLTMRHSGFMAAGEHELAALNQDIASAIQAWVDQQVESGALPRIDLVLLAALVIAPARSFARQWVEGRTSITIAQAKKLLSTAAWSALVALRNDAGRRGRGRG